MTTHIDRYDCTRLWRLLSIAVAALGFTATGVEAFTMSDGSTVTCTSYLGRRVAEVSQPSFGGMMNGGYTGVTVTLPDGSARITWDSGKLDSLPQAAHDFIFFHECAHAKVPTSDELAANCAGLLDMRTAGRSSSDIEDQLGRFHASLGFMGPRYGNGADYWRRTMQCAQAGRPASDSPAAATTTTCRFTYGPRSGDTVDFSGRPGVIPAMVGAQCTDGAGSFGIAVAGSPARRGPQVSTKCLFQIGPRAGQIQDYAPLPPLPVGAACNDGIASVGRIVP